MGPTWFRSPFHAALPFKLFLLFMQNLNPGGLGVAMTVMSLCAFSGFEPQTLKKKKNNGLKEAEGRWQEGK